MEFFIKFIFFFLLILPTLLNTPLTIRSNSIIFGLCVGHECQEKWEQILLFAETHQSHLGLDFIKQKPKQYVSQVENMLYSKTGPE